VRASGDAMNDNYFNKYMANRELSYNGKITFNELILKPGAKHYQDGVWVCLLKCCTQVSVVLRDVLDYQSEPVFRACSSYWAPPFANTIVIIVATAVLHIFTL